MPACSFVLLRRHLIPYSLVLPSWHIMTPLHSFISIKHCYRADATRFYRYYVPVGLHCQWRTFAWWRRYSILLPTADSEAISTRYQTWPSTAWPAHYSGVLQHYSVRLVFFNHYSAFLIPVFWYNGIQWPRYRRAYAVSILRKYRDIAIERAGILAGNTPTWRRRLRRGYWAGRHSDNKLLFDIRRTVRCLPSIADSVWKLITVDTGSVDACSWCD